MTGRVWSLLGVALAAVAIGGGTYAADLLENLELDSVDQRFAIRGDTAAPSDLAVVAIDSRTFSDLDLRWPFPRSVHAKAIDRLRRDGAKVIAVDIQFTEPTEEDEDNALIESVATAGNVVLATSEVFESGQSPVFGGGEILREIRATSGHALLPSDSGGVVRRMPYAVEALESFGVAAAERETGRPIDRADVGGDTAWIDYHGGPGTFPTTSFSRVVDGRFPRGTFRGKTVLIGPSAPSLQDLHATSTSGDGLMSGAEIQANAMSTARRSFPLRETGSTLDLLLVVLLGLAVPLAALRVRSMVIVAALPVVVAGLYLVAAQVGFGEGRILPVVHPLLALALASIGTLLVLLVVTAFERRITRDLFARFVPDAVVDEVLAKTGGGLRLGGEARTATVLFSDVRGFTTFSESRPPSEVIDVLNRYLTIMSDCILDEGGTLVAYMGDGIMAVFGAPLEQADHADRALRTARRMTTTALDEFNVWVRRHGIHEGFRIGVGLNSGEVVSGNVGSERRLEYSAIGDTTNTAARLESMTKGTPHSVFLSDATRAMLTRPAEDLVTVAEMEVRGKQAAVQVWTVGAEPAGEPEKEHGWPAGVS